jgi:sporulation protein YlmC with PRC-barrel domain
MSNEQKLIRKWSLRIATASAASAFLLVSPTYAQQDPASQGGSQDLKTAAAVEHRQLDQNKDQQLQWEEVQPRLEQAQLDDAWDEERVMGEFDQDDNDALDPREYQLFLVKIGEQNQSGQTAQSGQGQEQDGGQEVVVQSQQPRVKVDTDPAKVQVDPAQPNVTVQQQPPKVKVDPADPQVTVDQQKPKVIVKQPQPEVTVNMPKPEVEVVQRDPDVNVDKAKPEVQVEQQKPKVTVNQGRPDVDVQQPDPEVAVQPAKPRVVTDGDEQARVAVQKDEQKAKVQVEQAEPKVQVGSADPQVEVESAEGANVNIQRQQEQQQGNDVAVEDVNKMEPTAAGISSQEQQSRQSQLDRMRIEDLEGETVINAEGNEIGSIEQIVVARDTSEPAIVITSGGILGFGEEEVLIPLSELALRGDQLVWETTKTVEEMKKSDYEEQNYTRISTQDYDVIGDLKQNAQ